MKRRFRLTIEIDVADMSADERGECADLDGTHPRDLPKLKEIADASELAYLIVEAIPVLDAQYFEGSGIYAKFEDAKLCSAEWAPRKGPLHRFRSRRNRAAQWDGSPQGRDPTSGLDASWRDSPVGEADAPKGD